MSSLPIMLPEGDALVFRDPVQLPADEISDDRARCLSVLDRLTQHDPRHAEVNDYLGKLNKTADELQRSAGEHAAELERVTEYLDQTEREIVAAQTRMIRPLFQDHVDQVVPHLSCVRYLAQVRRTLSAQKPRTLMDYLNAFTAIVLTKKRISEALRLHPLKKG